MLVAEDVRIFAKSMGISSPTPTVLAAVAQAMAVSELAEAVRPMGPALQAFADNNVLDPEGIKLLIAGLNPAAPTG